MQATLNFDNPVVETSSPINKPKFRGQNMAIYSHLQSGKSIDVFTAITKYQIYHLHSRISDLRNKNKLTIYDRQINVNGNCCKEYSLTPFKI